jgi:dTDP-4-dehydrorhamnose reductase
MKILITGASGQLGEALRPLWEADEVVALDQPEIDVTDSSCIDTWFEDERPDWVIHCAAMTDTAACERDPERAREVNAIGTGTVARASVSHGARLIAVSTNEVFDGSLRLPYSESDAPRPINVYGASKRDGEDLAAAAHPNTLIVRTAWLYGDGSANFVEKVLSAARAGRPLRFVTDEVATPTAAVDLAQAIRALIEADAPSGVYHLTNEGEASRYEWAREIVRLAGFEASPVEPVTAEELRASGYGGPRKPAYSVLANTRARALGITLRPWREALASHFERARVAADG